MTTEHIIKTDKTGESHIVVKFHAPVKRFKRVETFKFGGRLSFFINIPKTALVKQIKLHKNGSFFNIPRCEQHCGIFAVVNNEDLHRMNGSPKFI